MIKTLYKMWLKESIDRASNDEQIQQWIKEFVDFADKIITPSKIGDKIGFSSGKRHFKIIRDK